MNGLDATFATLADPTRRAILARLSQGEVTVGELAKPFTISLAAVSRHLRILEEASLIVRERDGKHIRCRLQPHALAEAHAWLDHYSQFWTGAFDRLDAHLKHPSHEETTMAMPDPRDLSLEISRAFDAPPDRVFDAWLGREWGRWLPPGGATCEVAEMDPVVDGRYRVRMTMADGRVVEIAGRYVEVTRPTRLVLTWTGNYDGRETLISLSFRPHGTGTMMVLRQDGFEDPGLREGYRTGWTGAGGSFDKLAAHLAGS